MMQNNKLLSLVEISNHIGNNTAYIQGGGGNTSFKENDILFVKSSGTLLKNMSLNSGIAEIELNKLNKYLEILEDEENTFASKVQSYCINNQKPSIETGMHAVIPYKYVIHSHSVYANVITCSYEAEKILHDLFGNDYILVPYATPGIELIKTYKEEFKKNMNCKIIFLQNHGVVSFSDNPEDALNKHYEYSEIIKEAFKLDDFEDTVYDDVEIKDFLFPDQVVYSLNNADKSSIAYKETIRAYLYIYKYINQLKLTPNFLNDNNISAILGMDSEKYRAGIIQ